MLKSDRTMGREIYSCKVYSYAKKQATGSSHFKTFFYRKTNGVKFKRNGFSILKYK